jgi:hypothetical protein
LDVLSDVLARGRVEQLRGEDFDDALEALLVLLVVGSRSVYSGVDDSAGG